jgi:hypothetical protein
MLRVVHRGPSAEEPQRRGVLAKFHTLGLRGHGRQHAETELGRVTVAGAQDISDFDEVAGFVAIENQMIPHTNAEDWLGRVEDRIKGILLILSFAQGRFVGWSVRELFLGGVRTSSEFHGTRRSGAPFDPTFHYLNLQPALDMAATRYTPELVQQTGLDVAIEWFVMGHAYQESRFLATFAALEHLASKLPSRIGSALPAKMFGEVRRSLEEALASPGLQAFLVQSAPCEPERKAEFVAAAMREIRPKLGNLNGRSLHTKADALLTQYRVPRDDIAPTVSDLIAMRNRLVHRGVHGGDDAKPRLVFAVFALREYLRRLFLAMLDYEGGYVSYAGAPGRDKRFAKLPAPDAQTDP